MWTNEAKYDRDKQRYDLTDAEWAHVVPLTPPAKRVREVVTGSCT